MGNIRKTDKEIQEASKRFVSDPFIVKINDTIAHIYSISVPIAITALNIMYDDDAHAAIKNMENLRDNYIKSEYGSYFC